MVSILEREDEMNETDLMKKLHEAVQMVVIGVGAQADERLKS